MGTSWDPVDLRGLISRRSRIRIPPPLLPKPDHADKEVHRNNHDPSRAGFGFGSYSWTSVAWSGASIRHQFHGRLRALLGRASAPASRSQRRRRTSCARRDGPRSARRAPPAASRRAALTGPGLLHISGVSAANSQSSAFGAASALTYGPTRRP